MRLLVLIASFLLLVSIACESNAQRIREANEAAATSSSSDAPLEAEISVLNLRDGDCIISIFPNYVDEVDIESVRIVPCSGPWQHRVLSSFIIADSNYYPGFDFFSRQALARCDRRYTVLIYPTRDSWKHGDRTVNCLQER